MRLTILGLNRMVVTLAGLLLVSGVALAQSTYFQFGYLNQRFIDVTQQWTQLSTGRQAHTFTKSRNDTKIEVHVNSRFRVGSFNTARGVYFEVRIDGRPPTYSNRGSLLPGKTSEFLSMYAVFANLPGGSHTVSIWAQAPGGTASAVGLDPGGWGGAIIVKETN